MKIFDTHAHLGLIVDDPIEQIIVAQTAKQSGVLGILCVCNSLRDFQPLYENLINASNVYFAAGVSPSEVLTPGDNWRSQLEEFLKWDRVIALGETGLDYYRKYGDRNSQIDLFAQQLELADFYKKPVVIHNREAGEDIKEILTSRFPAAGALLHCYSESLEFAEKIMALHEKAYFSFAGNITYRSARDLQQVASRLPLSRIVIESESPFMVPAKQRGKRNTPSFITSTLEALVELRREDPEEIEATIFQNSLDFFQLSL